VSKSKSATLGILFVAVIWGAEFVLVNNAIDRLEVHSFNAIRFGAASLFIGFCMLVWKKLDGFNWLMAKNGAVLGILLYLGFSTQTFGLLYTSVSNSAFITSLNVVLVPIAAMILLGDRPRLTTLSGVGVAAGGLYFLTVAGATPFNFGDMLTLICAVMFALHIVFTGKYSQQHDAFPLIFIQLLMVSVLSLGSALFLEDWQRLLDVEVIGNVDVLSAIVVASLLGTGLAIMIQTFAQEHLTSTRVALIFSLEPVFATLTAFLVIDEQMRATAGLGAGLILSGILLTELPIKRGNEGLELPHGE